MANQVITKQELIDAQKDAQTLEEVISGEPGKLVETRLGRKVYTLASVPQINTMTREEVNVAVALKAHQTEIELNNKVSSVADIANQNILAEKQRAEAAEQGLQIQVNSVGVGNKAYKTYALMDADKTNIPAKSKVTVTNDATTSNNGDWQWDGSTFTKSVYDPLTQSRSYTDNLVKSKSLGQTDLNTLFTEGLYYQSTAANATAARNYPDHAQNTASSMRVVAMSTNTIMHVVEAAGKTSTRMIYSASTIPSFQPWITSINQTDKTAIDASIGVVDSARKESAIWGVSGSNGKISVDKASKTLSWNNALIAAFAKTTRRISIPAASFTFVNAFDTLFLDLSQVPVDGNITAELLPNCLKIAKYSDSAATAFIHKSTQLPLAQLNPQGEIVACTFGFPDLKTHVKDTFSYNKIADRINIYSPASNGNLINYLLRHDVKPFDSGQSQSQLDMWRLDRAVEVNGSLTELQEIVTYGEWEFTMREKEYPADHVGGVHGDEVLTSAYFLVDGVYKDPVSWTGSGEAKEIRLQLNSVIYRLNTQTAIADHYKELVITKNGITANQWVETRILLNPDRIWLGMLPTNRVAANSVQVSNKDIRNGIIRDISTAGFNPVYTPLKNGSYVNVSGDKYSTSVEISNLQGALETADIYVSNDAAYNKIYVSAIGGASSGVTLPAGTKISWTAKYKVDAI
ncbi:hypothetical protein GBN67_08095 [Acinetobacter johnsonii]|uniref:hypothetical protein n=1 Tax=Acinetobacter johnsonii TaxID=40214 RepID=UPI001F22D00C|nr:hypothetical protein [Acinetobacter johnsonii]UIZ94902.1 hypothetical protein GBN67_08095 [Acinetobacter johnsonii]